ncbi:MAG: nucleotidyltransferase domain-containing protein [Thermoplasmatota archaeon]
MKGPDPGALKKVIRNRLLKNGIRKASLFGSLHSGNFGENSDIDIMIEARENMSLLDLARLKRELEEISGFNVDLITYGSIDPRYRKRFMNNSEDLI